MAALATLTLDFKSESKTSSAIAGAASYILLECSKWAGAQVRLFAQLPDGTKPIAIKDAQGENRWGDDQLIPYALPSGTAVTATEIKGIKPGSTISVIVHP